MKMEPMRKTIRAVDCANTRRWSNLHKSNLHKSNLYRLARYCASYLLLAALAACGSATTEPTSPNLPNPKPPPTATLPAVTTGLAVPDNRTVQEFRVLLLGNSHVGGNNLAGMLNTILQHGRPRALVATHTGDGSYFLDERLQHNPSLDLLRNNSWSHVILQGQKYSMSGMTQYSTSATEYWVALTKNRQATPILFPEHARAGNTEEGPRVYLLHQSIAAKEAACVAPVDLAWQQSLQNWPGIALHLADGNHANEQGALLTALLFYQIITGDPADQLAFIPTLPATAQVQQQLRQQASATLQQVKACPF